VDCKVQISFQVILSFSFSFQKCCGNTETRFTHQGVSEDVTALQIMLDTDGLGCRVKTRGGFILYFNRVLRELIRFNYYFGVRGSLVLYIVHKCSTILKVIK